MKEAMARERIQTARSAQLPELQVGLKGGYVGQPVVVRQAKENYRIMQNRYLNQLAILTDLLDANSVRLNVELQLVTARTRVIYTYYQLQKACDRL